MPAAPVEGRVLMVMHGSPDVAYERAASAFMQAWQMRYPQIDASLCFLEHQSPLLADMLQQKDVRCLVPLFLNDGKHVRHDIPELVSGMDGVRISRPLIDTKTIADIMIARLNEMLNISGHLLLYSHGSRNDLQMVQRLSEVLRARLEWPVSIVFSSDGERGLGRAMQRAKDGGATSVTIAPHFLLEGRWRQNLEERISLLQRMCGLRSVEIAPPLGGHPAMFSLIERRVRECLGQD